MNLMDNPVKNLLKYFVNKILVPYVENAGQQFDIAFLSSDYNLENLKIKESAVNDRQLPVKYVYGTIGKLHIKIPPSSFFHNEPIVIRLEDVYLVFGPHRDMEYDEEKEHTRQLNKRRNELETIEAAKKAELEKDKPPVKRGLVERYVAHLIKYMRICIKNIHLRYEDNVSNPNFPLAMGLTLHSLEIETTDPSWVNTEGNNTDKKDADNYMAYKILQLDSLAVYFNCNTNLYAHLDIPDMIECLRNDIASKDIIPENYTYILGPINGVAKLRLNQRPDLDEPAFSVPKYTISIELDTLYIGVNKVQYRNLIAVADSMSRLSKAMPFRKFRPKVDGYRGHYKEWWKYAYECVLVDIRRKKNDWSWEHMSWYRGLAKGYREIYKKKLTNVPLFDLEEADFDEFERILDLPSVVVMRRLVEMELEILAAQEANKSWFSRLWGSQSQDDESNKTGADILRAIDKDMAPEERAKLFQAISYTENPIMFPVEYVDNSCIFLLKNLQIELYDNERDYQTVLHTDLNGVKLKVKTRSSALKADVNIDDFKVIGLRQDDFVPDIIISETDEDHHGLLEISYETSPLDGKCDQRIILEGRPIRIVYDAQTVIKLLDVFSVPADSDLDKIQEVAGSGLLTAKEKTATSLQHAIDTHAVMDVHIDFQAPYVIIPYGGKYTGTENVLVCNLGHVRMFSINRQDSSINVRKLFMRGVEQKDIFEQLKEQSYDRFRLEFTELQILMAQSDEDWKTAMRQSRITDMHMLNPLNLSMTLSHCLITDDPRLPLNTVAGELPSININISEARVMLLAVLATSIPKAPSSVPEPQPLGAASNQSSRAMVNYKEIEEYAKKPKPKPELPPDTDRAQLVHFITLEGKFVMAEFSITINKQSSINAETTELACFMINALECSLVQQTYCTDVSLLLGSILLKQNREAGIIKIIDTPTANREGEYLFKLQYIQVDPKSPELHSKYKSCEMSLSIDIHVVDFLLHQEGLLSLIQFSTDLQDQIAELTRLEQMDRVSTAQIGRQNSTVSTPSGIHNISHKPVKKKQVPVVVETIKVKLKTQLQEFSVKFATDKGDISVCSVCGVDVTIIMKDTYTQVNANLQEISVVDLNRASFYPLIISGTDETALITQIVLNNLEGESETPDIDVTVKMACLKIVFLNLFVSNMLNFMNQFQAAQQKIIEASQAAAETAKENMKDVYAKATKISLTVDLNAPNIIVPVSSTSYDALFLDLGILSLSNKFLTLDVKNEEGFSAVVDALKIKLTDLKIARVKLARDLKVVGQCLILEPIDLSLNVKRNLSMAWYTSIPDMDVVGKIKVIELLLRNVDYEVIMSILSGNLAEGKPEEPAPAPPPPKPRDISGTTSIVTTEAVIQNKVSKQEKVHVSMKFSFIMEKFIVSLYMGGVKNLTADTPSHDPDMHLARFSLEYLSLKGKMLTDQSMVTSILLVNCLLDDMRKNRGGKLTRMIERSMGEGDVASSTSGSSDSLAPIKSMIDITYQQKQSDTFADVRICSFTIILSVEYLQKVASFFKVDTPQEGEPQQQNRPTQPKVTETSSKISRSTVKSAALPEKQSQMTINLKVEKPDIIMVENMDNIDTKAMILNSEILVKLRMAGEHQVINGMIKDLQLYICSYNPARRGETRANILHPVNISLAGSTPEGKGLHLELLITDIRLGVSPATIELLNRVMVTLQGSSDTQDEDKEQSFDYINLWKAKPLGDVGYWFLRTDSGVDALELAAAQGTDRQKAPLQELCIVSIPSIIITIEAGVGNKTLPMLLFETNLKASARNWSSQMSIEASITLQMGYYNSRLALWEPLIEPVETTKDNKLHYVPWELKVEISSSEQDEALVSPTSESSEENPARQITNIDVTSESTLEVTVTKTCMEVMKNLGNAFATAIKSESIKPLSAMQAPYRVLNEVGEDVTLLLEKSSFRIARGGMVEDINKAAAVPLQLRTDYEREGPIRLSQELMSFAQKDSRHLPIKISRLNWEIALPIMRADKRFFMLNYRGEGHDNWGLVSDITVDEGVTIITLRSILQIVNHFDRPVDAYFMTSKGNELELIGTVQANDILNVPLKAVYTPTSELFFTLPDYAVTCAPYIWKDLQTNLTVKKLLQCPHKDSTKKDPFVFNVVGETEQVYYENTSRHTMASTCYNIHLRPAIVLKNCLPISFVCCVDEHPDEFTVNPGDTIQLPSIVPGINVLVLRIPEYLEKQWSCRNDVYEKPQEFSVWTFHSYDSAVKMTLDLGMHTLDQNGSLVMSLYCPFWMLNKTDLMLGYRTSDEHLNILYHPADFKGPILFSFNPKNFFGKKKACIRVGYGEWSDKFSLDVAGSSGLITCKTDEQVYQIGVHIQLTYNSLTKQVTFIPYHVIINNAPFPIECQESDRPADPWITVNPKSCSALWPRSELEDKLLHLRIASTNERTAPFIYTESHNTLLRLNNKYGGINVDIQLTEGAVYINLAPYEDGSAPALLVNYTEVPITYWEKESIQQRSLQPKHSILYTWENPSGPRILCWEKSGNKEVVSDLRRDLCGEFDLDDNSKVYWASFLDGMQRVLLFTRDRSMAESAEASNLFQLIQQEINVSIHGVGLSLVNNVKRQEIMYIGIASSGILWETSKLNGKRFKPLGIKESTHLEAAYQTYLLRVHENNDEDPIDLVSILDGKMVVDFRSGFMTKPSKRKIKRTFQTGLWVQMKSGPSQTQLHAKINRLQIDDQIYDCIFPVVLAPVPPPKSVAVDSGIKPFVEVSIVQLIMKNSQIKQYKYFKVLVQEFHIKVDLGFLNAIMDFLQETEASAEEQKKLFLTDTNLVNEPLYALASTQSIQQQKSFYDLLHFSPLKMHVSFSLAAGMSAGQNASTPNFLNILLQGIGVTLTDLQDVVFKLSYFERDFTFLTQQQLVKEATSHYVGQTVKQLYVLVLGLDVIGNPYGLVLGITKGVEDLFYEPFQGAIQGPDEFAEGLALGVKSLFGHTVGGAAGAMSRITGAMGKGIAALTFDEEYQRKRREALRKKPTTVQEGMARSGKGLVMGLYSGVTGVFTKPVEGAREQGVEGFFKGLGKGAVGLVTRPAAGVVDFASGSLDVVKRCTEAGEETMRLRAPRFLQSDGLVRPYNKHEAIGHRLLNEVSKGKYSTTDVYVCHYEVIDDRELLLLTDKRVAYVTHNDLFGGWQLEWSYTWDELPLPPKVVPKGVLITTHERKKKLFGSTDATKTVLIDNPTIKEDICQKIESLRSI